MPVAASGGGSVNTTAYDRLLDALARDGMKIRDTGDKARAQCPAHGSRGLSLAVRRADDRVLVKCFAECELVEILDALGMTMPDLFDGERPAGYTPPPRPKPTPWDPILRVGIDHLLNRITTEQALEADPSLRERARSQGDDCSACRSAVAR